MAGVGLGLTLALLSLTLRCWPVHSHGRLYEPPGRSTAHSRGFDTPANYNDMGLNCGGFSNQWDVHGGKCGVCGDPWQGPRENEAGGLYATGTIVRQFTMGEYMPIVLEITAPHRGWFEFRLCPHNDPSTPITQECLNQYKLPIYLHANGTTVTRFYSLETIPGSGWTVGKVYMLAKLPDYVTCTQCVLQWKWHTGNSWGTDPDGNSCVGCGPQEEFYGCADIAIYPPGQGTGGVTLPATPAPTGTGTTTGGDTGSTSAPPTAPGNMKVGCWFTNWAQHRSDLAAKFLPEDIDVNLCTHIYYAFAKVDRGTNGEFTVKPYEDNDFELYSRVIGLKHYKPTLKVLLAVGGWTHGTAAFNEMSATAVTRGQFLRNTIAYLRLHGFDGLDYDWEYPGVAWRGSGPETKQQFSDLVKV
ncbi:uncharacterized protein LOC106158689 [Lingula anatina]|uniref:Uncharacterized protein LOC106158689 n=1 Tax=Lingula anatina TaxID=7574 RepID=A0A1S3HW23_LINAN|nr:uncharacterized protein LOC106158689 [Lingula anatina]|eukprot:XP_013390218.1 uncharacterized protein LOC106158689 [Lingula anatina]